MGGPSGPTPCDRIGAIGPDRVGPEGPPTKTGGPGRLGQSPRRLD
ncbi:DUF6053 domain-containing protein [Lysobacter enzymogenes]